MTFFTCNYYISHFSVNTRAVAAVFWLGRQISHLPWAKFGFWVWGAKLEARRAEARGPKGWEQWWGSWGGGSEPPPHQLEGLGKRCKLPQRGPGQSPGRKRTLDVEDPIKRIWWWQISFNFKPQISLITAPFHHDLHRNIGPAAAGPAATALITRKILQLYTVLVLLAINSNIPT